MYDVLKIRANDWLKYRGMAILVCRKKNAAGTEEVPDCRQQQFCVGVGVCCVRVFYLNVFNFVEFGARLAGQTRLAGQNSPVSLEV